MKNIIIIMINYIISNIFAFIAILISIFTLYRQIRSESLNNKTANVSAIFLKMGNNQNLKIYNSGKALARNVNIKFLGENEIFDDSDIRRKLPITLHEHQSVELLAGVSLNSPPKVKFILTWDDGRKLHNKKEMEISV